jgi:SAM-dependent methyltransferase
MDDAGRYGRAVADGERAQIFGSVAGVYDETRPTYPEGAVDLIAADGPSLAVDVGCGTGKAARLVMARDVEVLGVEPDVRMAAIARSHGVRVEHSTFEEWVAVRCDVVFSAQAWHWVDPTRGAVKAAEALSSGGRWLAMWNREDDPAITAVLLDVYARLASHLIGERHEARDNEAALVERVTTGLASSGSFHDPERHDVSWTDRLTVAQLVARWSTHSGHRLLAPDVADELHETLVDRLGGPEHVVTLDYVTMALTARRR